MADADVQAVGSAVDTNMISKIKVSTAKNKRKSRDNTLEELRRKRIARKKKKKAELQKMTKKERASFLKKKITEPLQHKVEENELKYQSEKKVAAFYWNKWKEDKRQHLDDLNSVSKSRFVDRSNIKDVMDEKQSVIGEGVFGKVSKKIYRGIEVAAKYFKSGSVTCVKREAAIINNFDHPVLPLVFGLCIEKLPYILVMQFYGIRGSCITLRKALTSHLIEELTGWIPVLYKIADGLDYVHKKGYLHNDLKGDNIVITSQNDGLHPIIIDFGKSTKTEDAKLYSLTKEKQREYRKYHKHIAPEVVAGIHSQSFASDIFAFGMIITSVTKSYESSIEVLQEIANECIHDDPLQRPYLRTLLHSLNSS